MKQEHFSDEEIQDFILQRQTNEALGSHLVDCEICRQKLKEYDLVIGSLHSMERSGFHFPVASLVMQQIESQRQKRRVESYVFYGFLFILMLLPFVFVAPMLEGVFKAIAGMSGASMVFLFTGSLSVLIYLMADLFRAQKEKESQLFVSSMQPAH